MNPHIGGALERAGPGERRREDTPLSGPLQAMGERPLAAPAPAGSAPGGLAWARAPMAIPMHSLQAADRALGRAACVALQPLRWSRALKRPRPRAERVLLIKFWGV